WRCRNRPISVFTSQRLSALPSTSPRRRERARRVRRPVSTVQRFQRCSSCRGWEKAKAGHQGAVRKRRPESVTFVGEGKPSAVLLYEGSRVSDAARVSCCLPLSSVFL